MSILKLENAYSLVSGQSPSHILGAAVGSADLRTVPTNSKVFLRGFMNMREKQISTSVIKIQKENWG